MKNMTVYSGSHIKIFAVLAGLLCLSIASGVSAKEGQGPCAEDAAKLCKGMQPGDGHMAKCMQEHAGELSPACKQNIKKTKEAVQSFREACKADMEKLCKNTKPGGGRIMQCLKQHEADLSAACKEKTLRPKGEK